MKKIFTKDFYNVGKLPKPMKPTNSLVFLKIQEIDGAFIRCFEVKLLTVKRRSTNSAWERKIK